ncbi:MAG: hypothetical protein A2Y10_02420 [Planctomycetes bacterium GWF2_41_51]|nr:MAG: hypothetical protein A2Y10_02420 [Planctomycetes bacterium GWF2_41_51]
MKNRISVNLKSIEKIIGFHIDMNIARFGYEYLQYVIQKVKIRIETVDYDGGLILAPSYWIQSPFKNISF